jgi:hypothetical protein
MRFFRLSDGGVQCGEDGLFVGSTPLLLRSARPGGGDVWAVRPSDAIDRDLSDCYGLPIDAAAKHGKLRVVARALERGDLALAKIAAVLLQFPDPPSLAKGAAERGSLELAARLFESGLLKDWDSSLHPRLGGPPNSGWFAQRPSEAVPARSLEAPQGRSLMRESFRAGLRLARMLTRTAAEESVKLGELALRLASKAAVPLEAIVEILDSSELNRGEQQVLDQMRSSLDPPKTLEELQRPPTQNVLGYEQHHIVEQNPSNIAKSPAVEQIEKFGRDVIDDPSNIVWVPRLTHELISGYYNAKDEDDPDKRLRRQVVNDMDFNGQREAGLAALRKFGVLQ